MILRWLIGFSLTAILASAATVSGSVALLDSREPAVRGRKDFSGVVVWLEPMGGTPQPVRVAGRTQIVQKGKRFTPHILPITAGTTVEFPNFDPIFHNAFSNFEGKVFDVGLYAPGTSRAVRFDRPGIVRVFCNIHPHMSAIIAVLNSIYFATSSENGRFQILNVPPGEYRLRVMHERATQETLDRLARRIVVVDPALALPSLSISESGYLRVAHKNKYGKDYPPASGDSLYGGEKNGGRE